MSSIRYVEMSEPIYEQINKRVRNSFPNSCICWIEEVINPALREAYESRKRGIQAARKTNPNEVQFFHGTYEGAINSIISGGFNPDYNKTSAYGKGTYFAKNASYSFSYMKPNTEGISFMFLCDVLLGVSSIGTSDATLDTKLYDSFVNQLTDPTIVVTPYADGAYPKYIIAFHKTAN
jgi:hypothetical protein